MASKAPDRDWQPLARPFALAGLALALAGAVSGAAPRMAAAEAPPLAYRPMRVANGCFVESVACFDAFHEAFGGDGWVRVLEWGAQEQEVMVAGHAVAVLEAADALWCWDINHGWMRLQVAAAERDNAAVVAAPILANYPRVTALYPMLWNDDGQVADMGPPGAEPAPDAGGPRDARLVAARLARHRPVNLLEITRGAGGENSTSEAVVFVFGGRTCVYTPEKGSYTFRVRSTVWNVRLVQDIVRYLFPDVQKVRRLALPEPGS